MTNFFIKYKMWIFIFISCLFLALIGFFFFRSKKDKQKQRDTQQSTPEPEPEESRGVSVPMADDESPYTPIFFKHSEFDSKDAPGSGKNMKNSTLRMLDFARKQAGVPFRVNSGYRTAAHNKKVGGKPNSAHLRGYAADIAVTSTTLRPILKALYAAGFRRFGVSSSFVHIDNDPSLPKAVWDYKNLPNNPYKTIQQIAAL